MSDIQKVAVVGASGNTGTAIVDALLKHGFEVTAITREGSTATFPPQHVSSKDGVLSAIRGQDAVVSCIAQAAVGGQDVILDAAVEAKVKRFLPSDYGIDYISARSTKVGKCLEGKVQTVDYLNKLTQQHTWFSWTGVATGMFFDWGLERGALGFDLKTRTATIIDSGNEAFSTTNLATIGQAVASILHHPEQTANRMVKISSFKTTQNEVLQLLQAESGEKWQVKNTTGQDVENIGDSLQQSGNPLCFVLYLQRYTFSDGGNTVWKDDENDNKLLELKQDEDIRETIRRVLGESSSRV
ncbi:hypothetical protein B0J12DRAFT_753879 [Macrophomina phaseolina]|uniref:NmrA-like domain-containing protein n=1 Tax=Macrophomina phaseolina TaxID=35725 RepID=A0ABQ8GDZ4_9PEZI|nr:hypothetical protein B0J12DRAFT_753879 [Macrophomina phaseolina]